MAQINAFKTILKSLRYLHKILYDFPLMRIDVSYLNPRAVQLFLLGTHWPTRIRAYGIYAHYSSLMNGTICFFLLSEDPSWNIWIRGIFFPKVHSQPIRYSRISVRTRANSSLHHIFLSFSFYIISLLLFALENCVGFFLWYFTDYLFFTPLVFTI